MRGATNCRQLSAEMAVLIRRLWPLFVALACLVGQAGSGSLGQESKPQATPQSKRLQLSGLFSQGPPLGLIEFYVPNPPGSSDLDSPRLGVLDRAGFRIFRSEGVDLVEEFKLPDPQPLSWIRLQSFPSTWRLPGVVLWGGGEALYDTGTVVCYVRGKPRVVFEEGNCMEFVDLDLDGIPEILDEGLDCSATDTPPQFVTVWTWDGSRYVKVKRVAFDQLYSKEIVAEVRNAKKPVRH